MSCKAFANKLRLSSQRDSWSRILLTRPTTCIKREFMRLNSFSLFCRAKLSMSCSIRCSFSLQISNSSTIYSAYHGHFLLQRHLQSAAHRTIHPPTTCSLPSLYIQTNYSRRKNTRHPIAVLYVYSKSNMNPSKISEKV